MSMHIRNASPPDGHRSHPRPRVLPLMLAVFCISNLIRSVLALQQVVQLPDVPGSASYVYVAVTSAGWAVVFAICAIAALLKQHWTAWAAILAAVFNQTHAWADRLLFSRSTESFQTLGFAAFISFVLLLTIIIPALSFRHAKPRSENRQTAQTT